jgi:methyl-accepting chemotaxis protein
VFGTISLRKKIWSIPAATVFVFALTLAYTLTYSTRTANTIANLGTVRYPSVDITQRLERDLKTVVGALQSAVAEGDKSKLAEVESLAAEFRKDTALLKALDGEAQDAEQLRTKFDAYFDAAMNASSIMMSIKSGDSGKAIADMQARYTDIENKSKGAANAAQEQFKASLDAGVVSVQRIVWTTVLGALLVIAGLVLISHFIVRSLWRQLGGDPEDARIFADKIAAGDLTAQAVLAPKDTHSLMASLQAMAARLNSVISAQALMSREHDSGNIDHRIDAEQLPGSYRELARKTNQLVDGHIKVKYLLVNVLQHYGRGDFSVDLPALPGKEGELTRAAAEAKRHLLAINTDLKLLVDAAKNGNFAARRDSHAYENVYREMIEGMNEVMAACETGITNVSRVLEALAQGDLTAKMEGNHSGQFADLQRYANSTIAKLTVVINEIMESMGSKEPSVRSASNKDNLSTRIEHQAASLEETASSMEEITAAVRQNAENASRGNELAVGASNVAVKGGDIVSRVVDTMSSIESSSKRIVDIIGVIDSIAFQTNILALNAAVEAARAGEQGRGFAVVATEVRNLAQRTVTAAKEIKQLIGESVETVVAGTALVGTAGQTMNEIVEAINRVTVIMREISTASAEQSSGIESVNMAITQIDQATQQNAALVEKTSATLAFFRSGGRADARTAGGHDEGLNQVLTGASAAA